MPALVRQQWPLRKYVWRAFRASAALIFSLLRNILIYEAAVRRAFDNAAFALPGLVCYTNELEDILTRSNELWPKNQP